MKKVYEGSLFIGIVIMLMLITLYIGIVIRSVSLFSSFALKKQEHAAQMSALDALLQYGIAHAKEQYAILIKKNDPTVLFFSSWPLHPYKENIFFLVGSNAESSTINFYSGKISIEPSNEHLSVKALLSKQGALLQIAHCSLMSTPDKTFIITHWSIESAS